MPPKKRKQPEKATERRSDPVRSLTSWSIGHIDQLNARPNCQWDIAHAEIDAIHADAPDPNPGSRQHLKQVSITFPCAKPGDLVVCTLNDGFVADDGAFVLPNSTYSFQIPEGHAVHANGSVTMACSIPIVSWHKRKDPKSQGAGELAWVYTEYARGAPDT